MSSVRPFTPTREDPADLDDRTVGAAAEEIIDRLADRIKESDGGSINHTLVIGPRGSGKTHVLSVARHRASRGAPETAARIVVVPEDGHGFVTYVELLRHIGRALHLGDSAAPGWPSDIGSAEAAVLEALGDHSLVLMIENLDRFFTKLGTGGQHDLRAWVESSRQILLIATSPLLFEAVSDRRQPWFGSFTPEFLSELSVEDGALLLVRLRSEDDALHSFLDTDTGQARLAALHRLTGGSPRLWTILADVVTVHLLDELVPAVERLLEELVTYYQQRLWELGPNEERVVTALTRGPAARTATQLATELGLAQNIVGTTLGRLSETRMVRGRKVPGTDQRSTWYELREPLLRHYLQYRTEDRHDELTLIVEMLRHWFDRSARERELLNASPDSYTERYFAAALALDWGRTFDAGFTEHQVRDLLLQARRWINDRQGPTSFSQAGRVIEAALRRLGHGSGGRSLPRSLARLVDGIDLPGDGDTVGVTLDRLAQSAEGRLGVILEWVAASWWLKSDRQGAVERLRAVRRTLEADEDLLAMNVDQQLATLSTREDPGAALPALEEVLVRRLRHQAVLHPDVLQARYEIAECLRRGGDGEQALTQYQALAGDLTEVLGDHHDNTFLCRLWITSLTLEGGRAADALTLARELESEATSALGSDHVQTLTARANVGALTAGSGDPAGALSLLRGLLPDMIESLGDGNPLTFATRALVASIELESGQPAAAVVTASRLWRDHIASAQSSTELEQAALTVMAIGFATLLKEDRAALRDLPTDLREGPLGLMVQAVEGSALALAQLPEELRAIASPHVAPAT